MPKLRSVVVATALALAATFPLAPSALALHSCNLDDYPTLDQICESHGIDLPLIQKLICLISKSC